MAWVKPEFSKRQIDLAGRVLAEETAPIAEQNVALDVLNNWRSSHSFPLNTFQMGLRNRSQRVTSDSLIAQRLKRVPSIVQKLRRFPSMSLSRMQDIGGCRAVLPVASDVRAVRDSFVNSSVKHTLVNEKDYIAAPKESGYRGVHLVYRYRSDRNQTYDGLQVEIQVRSRMQHAWATAVETVGTFLGQALKASEGEEGWLTFFTLMSSAFAMKEGCPPVPGTPGDPGALKALLLDMARELKVEERLSAYSETIRTLEGSSHRNDHFFILALRPLEATLDIWGYHRSELATASSDYLRIEKEIAREKGAEAVLVAVESLEALRQAYPNYFLDTQVFLHEMRLILGVRSLNAAGVRPSKRD